MYNIRRTDTILIYGGGYVGKDLFHRLNTLGYQIEVFLDKRADLLVEIEGRKVYYPDKWPGNREEAVVIVATGNSNSVANYLYSLGFRKIIYNSSLACDTSKVALSIFNVFNAILNDKDFPEEIPFYSAEMDCRFIDGAFIKQIEDDTIAYVPTELLFERSNDTCSLIYTKYADSLLYLKAFAGVVQNVSEIDMFNQDNAIERMNGYDFKSELESRRSYIQSKLNIWNQKLNYGMDWFIQNPVHVCADGGKFFVLEKDVLQILFFMLKGLQRIPAIMTNEDYAHWMNDEMLSETINYARSHDLPTSYTPLEHPCFYNYPAARDIGDARTIHICEYLKHNNISVLGKKVIDIGSYFGYVSRFFNRMGADVTSVELEEDRFEFSQKLNKLLHCESIKAVCGGAQDIQQEKEFDIVVMLTVLYWHLDTPIGLEIIRAVDRMGKQFLIWESGSEPARERKFIIENSSFSSYQKICETVGSGKVRELGVFSKT